MPAAAAPAPAAPVLRLSLEQYRVIVAHCLDGLPDEATRLEARRLIDPHLKGGSFEEESV